MHRCTSFLLLSVLSLISLLGNAGFYALGLHTCSQCSRETTCTATSMVAHSTPDYRDHCCPTTSHDTLPSCLSHSDQHSKQPLREPSEECAACDFFNVVQTNATPVVLWDGYWTLAPTRLFPSNDILLAFEFFFQRAPRGPPAFHPEECIG